MSSTVVILIKVDVTLQTKYLSLKPLLKEQSMLDGNRPPYRMFIDLGVLWQPEKKRIGYGKTRLHTCAHREEGKRDGGHGDIGDKPRTTIKVFS